MAAVTLDLGLSDTHVVVTGGAGFIGSATVSAFLSAGAKVTCLDINADAIVRLEKNVADSAGMYPSPLTLWCDTVDISDEQSLIRAFEKAEAVFGPVQCCIALASLDLSVLGHVSSIIEMPAEQWKRTHEVNVFGTFLTAKTWLSRLHKLSEGRRLPNCSLVIVGSESGLFGERGNADYASAKSAVQGGLLQSLKADAPKICPGARVNAIAPGPVDTPQFRKECKETPDQLWLDAQGTTALGKPVSIKSVARSIVFLASDAWSGSVHGTILRVDAGKDGKVHHVPGEIDWQWDED